MKVSILHPFTPKAAGVVEKSVPTYHSQPHVLAMNNLAKIGYECSIEYFTYKIFKYRIKGSNIVWNFHPVTKTFNGDHKKWKKQFSKACLKAYIKHTLDVTIINMSGHSSPFSYELSKVISKNGKKYIAMLGGQHYTDNPRNRKYYRNAHHLLVHTELQKRQMETMDLFKNKDIRVFPLGVDCTVFKPLESNEKIKEPSLLFVGRIVELKRIHLAIEAIHKLVNTGFKNAKLNIIGPVSSESYFTELKKMVVEYSLDINVFFLGHKEHSELPYYFQQASLLLLPSAHESFGMVMVEAMACGTPVAAITGAGGPDEIIDDNVNGILCAKENYAEKIVNYFKNKEQQKRISNHARVKVLKEYSIDATFQVLKKSVEDALN